MLLLRGARGRFYCVPYTVPSTAITLDRVPPSTEALRLRSLIRGVCDSSCYCKCGEAKSVVSFKGSPCKVAGDVLARASSLWLLWGHHHPLLLLATASPCPSGRAHAFLQTVSETDELETSHITLWKMGEHSPPCTHTSPLQTCYPYLSNSCPSLCFPVCISPCDGEW